MEDFTRNYLLILKNKFSGLNLTRHLSYDDLYYKQVMDSLLINKIPVFSQLVNNKRIFIDIGFGGGFPLLPLAYAFPYNNFIGIESVTKKCNAVKIIAGELNIKNITVINMRIENILIDLPTVLLFKAVGKIELLLKLININKISDIFFYKGPNYRDELDNLHQDWQLVDVFNFKIDDIGERNIIHLKNKNVPCGTKIKKYKLVNLSNLI